VFHDIISLFQFGDALDLYDFPPHPPTVAIFKDFRLKEHPEPIPLAIRRKVNGFVLPPVISEKGVEVPLDIDETHRPLVRDNVVLMEKAAGEGEKQEQEESQAYFHCRVSLSELPL
jgi:hypothetical protein